MTIFFYANIEYDSETIGITRKVKRQVDALKQLKYNVYLAAYRHKQVVIIDNQGIPIVSQNKIFDNKKIQYIMNRRQLLKLSTCFINSNVISFDYAYLRFHYFDRSYVQLLRALKKNGTKVVIEMHGWPLPKLTLGPKLIYRVQNAYYSRSVKKYIDKFATMSLHEYIYGIKTVRIENVVSKDEIVPKRDLSDPNKLTLLIVAYERISHGYDRIMRGIGEYYKNGGESEIVVRFVGKPLKSTIRLVKSLGVSKHVLFLGPLSGKLLDDQYDLSDIALGHFGNHRVGNYLGSAIKTTEYIAKGISFIYAWPDIRLSEDYKFAKRFTLDERPINMEEVFDFLQYNSKSVFS
ncbi:hypothetical protein AGMMS49992_21160 [Clostridia bacterium]|nr:hypothetical protein AGMMS49992_21160 [Clostridia bacterium]